MNLQLGKAEVQEQRRSSCEDHRLRCIREHVDGRLPLRDPMLLGPAVPADVQQSYFLLD